VIPIPIPAFSPEESSFVVFLEGEYVAVTATITNVSGNPDERSGCGGYSIRSLRC
jgi:hypothetical protein